MPKWDLATERKLLLTIIEVLNTSGLQYDVIAAKMGEGYTKEAVRQHFAKLRRGDGKGDTTESNPPTPGLTFTAPKGRKKGATPGNSPHISHTCLTPTGRHKVGVSKQTEDSPTAGRKRKKSAIITPDNEDDSEVEVKKAKMEDQRGNVIKTEEVLDDGSIDLAHDCLYE